MAHQQFKSDFFQRLLRADRSNTGPPSGDLAKIRVLDLHLTARTECLPWLQEAQTLAEAGSFPMWNRGAELVRSDSDLAGRRALRKGLAIVVERKGAWRRTDRVMLGQATAQRAAKLGLIGEQLAIAELYAHGFTSIKALNYPTKNHPFADVYAERGGDKYWISVKARNKYQTDGSRNYCYKISPKERAFALRLEQDNPGTEAVCVAVSVVVSQNSCRDGESPNSYSCYFARLRELTDQQGIGMRKHQLPKYECFAQNKRIPADYDVSDCENVFRRRDIAKSVRSQQMPMTAALRLKGDIDTIRESIRINWLELEPKPLAVEERRALRSSIARLSSELHNMIARLDALP